MLIPRLRSALTLLHSAPASSCEMSDQLVLPTLGSQEGAFENVKMNFTGEQGQTIRQLLNAHMIRRGIMCCLSSPGGRRQHLAVAHEKGKITVLQLSALLKQADSSQKKLTLTRLASAPVPFTVLSLVSNPTNENLLAVCGLKDCHVLTFNSSGGVQEQLVLQPQLEAANYIIKPVWLPGSQTQMALCSADSVKIYELSEDALSPAYYFLVPSGKIRDVTFVHAKDGSVFLILMSSAGHVYFEQLSEQSSARHGSFYVTNIMEVRHPEVRDVGGSLAGGGVSIYYSHTLVTYLYSTSNSVFAFESQFTGNALLLIRARQGIYGALDWGYRGAPDRGDKCDCWGNKQTWTSGGHWMGRGSRSPWFHNSSASASRQPSHPDGGARKEHCTRDQGGVQGKDYGHGSHTPFGIRQHPDHSDHSYTLM